MYPVAKVEHIGGELAESELWERIAKREIMARAEDKRKAVDQFLGEEMNRVHNQHEAESKLAHKYQTALSELEETKIKLADVNKQLRSTATNLENAVSSAKSARASLVAS